MGLTDDQRAVADALYRAYRTGEPCRTPEAAEGMSLADGYAVQRELVERRRSEEGPQVGYKVGYTSRAIQEEVGVDEPAWGRLLAGTVRPDGQVDIDGLVDPKIEAEIAFRLEEPLDPPLTRSDVLSSASVLPAIEIVDTRTESWTPPVPVRVADNAHSGLVVHGETVRPATDLDPALEGVRVRHDGRTAATGLGADVLDGPTSVVRWLAETLADVADKRLRAGDLVLTGSTTGLVPFSPGDTVEARYTTLGSVSVSAVGGVDGDRRRGDGDRR